MNNIGGNLPILVDPLAKAIGYRESISVFYAGFYLISKSPKSLQVNFLLTTCLSLPGSVLFFITMFWMEGRPTPVEPTTMGELETGKQNGHDNVVFTHDELPRDPRGVENSKL